MAPQADTITVLDELLDPLTRCFTADVARQIADLRASPSVQGRIDRLAQRAAEGEITEAERDEYERYVEAIDVVGLLQAKARAVLAKQGGN